MNDLLTCYGHAGNMSSITFSDTLVWLYHEICPSTARDSLVAEWYPWRYLAII